MNWFMKRATIYPENLSKLYYILGQIQGVADRSDVDPIIKDRLMSIATSLEQELAELNSKSAGE